MKATSFEDLKIWQSARELSKEIYTVTRLPEFSKDYRFVGQITAAMGSVMDNIAEGFSICCLLLGFICCGFTKEKCKHD